MRSSFALPQGQAGLHTVPVRLSLFVCSDKWLDFYFKLASQVFQRPLEKLSPGTTACLVAWTRDTTLQRENHCRGKGESCLLGLACTGAMPKRAVEKGADTRSLQAALEKPLSLGEVYFRGVSSGACSKSSPGMTCY